MSWILALARRLGAPYSARVAVEAQAATLVRRAEQFLLPAPPRSRPLFAPIPPTPISHPILLLGLFKLSLVQETRHDGSEKVRSRDKGGIIRGIKNYFPTLVSSLLPSFDLPWPQAEERRKGNGFIILGRAKLYNGWCLKA